MKDSNPSFQNQDPFTMLVPRSLDSPPSFLPLSLTRRQRVVYFLIDDQRTIARIASCCNKTCTEIEIILAELQDLNLVTI